mmetsp:Transcript_51982/g.70944  ORF Transcript_51982/g.70944 Transcript_51982/m.70944 type:complete len:83 (+) Transcript_51982:197-445(+)
MSRMLTSKVFVSCSPRSTPLVQPVRNGCSCRFINDTQDFKPSDGAGILGRLALAVVKVGRNGHHRVLDFLADVGFGGLLHLH